MSLRSCTFSWGTGDEHAFLKDVNWYVPDSALVAVVGSVGSGKSSLLAAILGEMVKVTGHINVRGQVAYVPQQAWMQNETLKNNVLFGKRFNKDIYEKVNKIEACYSHCTYSFRPLGLFYSIRSLTSVLCVRTWKFWLGAMKLRLERKGSTYLAGRSNG